MLDLDSIFAEDGALAPSQPSAGLRLPATLRALRHRNFQLFFSGQLISLIGTWMQSVAQSWLVYSLSGSTVLLGLVGFASQIPVFVLAPMGGGVADALDRHRIVVATQTAAMVLAAILAYFVMVASATSAGDSDAPNATHALVTEGRGGYLMQFNSDATCLRPLGSGNPTRVETPEMTAPPAWCRQ